MPIRKQNRVLNGDHLEIWLKSRPAKKLINGDHLPLYQALKCFCQRCNRLLNWDSPVDESNILSECCGVGYKLIPWTVKVEVIDHSESPILPKAAGSDFPDLTISITDQI